MSHNTGNFVHELVIMAKAFEELPTIKLALEQSEAARSTQLEVIQELQLRIIDYKNKLDEAKANTRKVEAERDELELRFLEADDKIAGFTRLIKDQAKAFGLLLEAVEPAKPEPVRAEEALADPTKRHDMFPEAVYYEKAQPEPVGERASDPTQATADGGVGTSGQSESPLSTSPEQSNDSVPVDSGIGMQSDPGPAIGSAFTLPPQEVNELEEWAARPLDPELPVPGYPTEGVSVPADPTQTDAPSTTDQSTSVPSTVESVENVEDTAIVEPPLDDVGYHNEPLISTEPGGWQAWDSWCTRMNRRYGGGSWPARPATA